MTNDGFVHLNVHSDFSMKDSLIKVPALIKNAINNGMSSVAITDVTNLHGSIKLYKNAIGGNIKPIIGAELNLYDKHGTNGPLYVYCKNILGYKNLLKLVSLAYKDGRDNEEDPSIKAEWVTSENFDGLLAVSGGRTSAIGKHILASDLNKAEEDINWLKSVFNDSFYIELQRIGHPDDNAYNKDAVKFASRLQIPVVATNAARFTNQEDYESHQLRAAIALKMTVSDLELRLPNLYTPHQYFKSTDEMIELFKDIPSAIENTVEIAKRCTIEIELGKCYLPAYPYAVKENLTEAEFMNKEAWAGLEERLLFLYPHATQKELVTIRQPYDERLKWELEIINDMGFPGYFLIVMEFIQWSKDNRIPVGPGRGSGAGSLVAYALKITDLDPLEFDLLFERFLNPERVSMPDFDIDICMDRRGEVIQHTADMYGDNAVSQIATFGTMAARGVVRDVARALGLPYRVGDSMAKLIPNEPGITLERAITESVDFQQLVTSDERIKEVMIHAKKLEGLARQTGRHAGGVVIAAGNITDFCGVTVDENGEHASTMLDKNDVEDVGLVKFDYLGLRTLTIIQNAENAINVIRSKNRQDEFKILSIPLNDEKTFKLLQACETTAVFQLESQGMKTLIRRLQPSTFEEIIALVALFRPGPLDAGMVDDFVDRKHGRAEVQYIIPQDRDPRVSELLKPVLENTYGVIVYQEQVMQTAQVLAGYTLGGADMLRRAMGKKKPSEMAKQRSVFVSGCENNKIDPKLANEIFDLIEKFAGYGFNKSHSAAYALLAYQTAWLKAHYPAQFMAAVISAGMDKTDKVVTFLNECESMNLEVLPPRVNMSENHFVVNDSGQIVYGLAAVKGIGEAFVKQMVANRNEFGPFKNMFDWIARTNANSRVIKAAVKAGALDGMGSHRASLIEPDSYKPAQVLGKKLRAKDEIHPTEYHQYISEANIVFTDVPEWTDEERLFGEREKLGLYLTGHPLDSYEDELKSIITGKLVDHTGMQSTENGDAIDASEGLTGRPITRDEAVVIAGQIIDLEIKNGKKGNFAVFKVDDKTRQLSCRVMGRSYQNNFHLLKDGQLVVIKGRIKWVERYEEHQITAFEMSTIEDIRNEGLSYIRCDADETNPRETFTAIKEALRDEPIGGCRIYLRIHKDGRSKESAISDMKIKVTNQTLEKIYAIVDKSKVELVYRKKGAFSQSEADGYIRDHRNEEMREIGERTRARRNNEFASMILKAKAVMGQ